MRFNWILLPAILLAAIILSGCTQTPPQGGATAGGNTTGGGATGGGATGGTGGAAAGGGTVISGPADCQKLLTAAELAAVCGTGSETYTQKANQPLENGTYGAPDGGLFKAICTDYYSLAGSVDRAGNFRLVVFDKGRQAMGQSVCSFGGKQDISGLTNACISEDGRVGMEKGNYYVYMGGYNSGPTGCTQEQLMQLARTIAGKI
ncbi:MAG: hypothetical protein NT067_01375 [Candidatus Diapherotrites archaeon]|nr:hypothetical protein [Candidatus Diapherotrites archaeon]